MQAPVSQPESPYETARRLENVIRRGTVAEVRLRRPARVRVRTGTNVTDWLPWFALRAGGTEGGRHWNPPIVGEPCAVLSQGGDLAQGVVLIGLYSDAMPQGSELPACDRTDWDAENYLEWLRGTLTLYCTQRIVLSVNDQCSVSIDPERVTITASGAQLVIAPDRITSNVDIVAQGVSLVHHRHGGMKAGGDLTAEPVAS